ncbi:hypothetical protein CERZMDRAFT_118819 [Cercospora zeae-maydis SCOH1-5]|uniref:PH domain-containing protein n=1 Tax=Cercospora zeae-maydis SCOH1-5 TaxID=717836 RepID=A0A6A6F571_9PEZI|nr:hypothetical protein CERZMDRAFT_118819 [Cercospora zeae-maydis SCOH1-5]
MGRANKASNGDKSSLLLHTTDRRAGTRPWLESYQRSASALRADVGDERAGAGEIAGGQAFTGCTANEGGDVGACGRASAQRLETRQTAARQHHITSHTILYTHPPRETQLPASRLLPRPDRRGVTRCRSSDSCSVPVLLYFTCRKEIWGEQASYLDGEHHPATAMSNSYSSVPPLSDSHAARGYGTSHTDFASQGNPVMTSPLAQSVDRPGIFHEDFDASQRGSSIIDGPRRSVSRASTTDTGGVSRSNTLKKKSSVKRSGSLGRSGSKRSLRAGSIKGVIDADSEDFNSYAFTPVPTTGTPTEVLANRFQAWRQLLKSLIAYFREIQNSYESRGKALHKVHNTISNITHPAIFMSNDGLSEASRILEAYHKRSIAEAAKAREIENDVIGALTGLRSDLGQKIKEIKSLSGDFKNSVEKEKAATKQEVEKLQEALQHAAHEDGNAVGKNDPYVVRLGVDRQIERQVDEENYLHRAYLNLESSGRELESIVVGEIQKAYNALAGILKREADDAYSAVESLRGGPISMPKDQEWYQFVTHDPHFVDPSLPLRRIEDIEYPGKHAPAASEIRAGMLERKSKYLKSYTPGWYVLSPTHLHEFKSADKIYSQPPVMSLYLFDQKLGSHSERGSSSHKFMLKGKQSGGMHKGHNWVFRAESFDTMMAWFQDIRMLTEATGEQRQAFVRKHARSVSGTSDKGTVSSDGLEDDEADQAPYSADVTSLAEQNPIVDDKPRRPQPGGRFPSDMFIRKAGAYPPAADGAVDDDSDDDGAEVIAAAGAVPGSSQNHFRGPSIDYGGKDPYRMDNVDAGTVHEEPFVSRAYTPPHQEELAAATVAVGAGAVGAAAYNLQQQDKESAILQQSQVPPAQPVPAQKPLQTQTYVLSGTQQLPASQQQAPSASLAAPLNDAKLKEPFLGSEPAASSVQSQPQMPLAQSSSDASNIIAPAAASVAGIGAGVVGTEAYRRHQQDSIVPSIENKDVSPIDNTQDQTQRSHTPSNVSTISRERSIRASPIGNSIAAIALGNEPIPPPASPPFAAPAAVPSPAQPTLEPTLPQPAKEPAAAPTTALPTASTIASELTTGSPSVPASSPLGGNEAHGAHETGQIFPRVIRHDTNLSISNLHVPGEFK